MSLDSQKSMGFLWFLDAFSYKIQNIGQPLIDKMSVKYDIRVCKDLCDRFCSVTVRAPLQSTWILYIFIGERTPISSSTYNLSSIELLGLLLLNYRQKVHQELDAMFL